MQQSLSELPTDTYQEILYHLFFPDAVSLLQTCRLLYFSRSLWFQVIEQARSTVPLPGPFNEDYSSMDLEALQNTGQRARRLVTNLSRHQPLWTSVETLDLRAGATDQVVVTVVPGTRIILTQAWRTSILSCWDLSDGAKLIDRIENVRLDVSSPPHIEDHEFIIAIISKSHQERMNSRASLVVVSVNYSDRSHVIFSETYRKQISLGDPRLHPALHSKTRGILAALDVATDQPMFASFDTASQDDSSIMTLQPIDFQISRAINFIHLYSSQGQYYMRMELRSRQVEILQFSCSATERGITTNDITQLSSLDGHFGYTTHCNLNIEGVNNVSRRSEFSTEVDEDPASTRRLKYPVTQQLTLTYWLTGDEHYSFTFDLDTSRFHSQVIWQSGPTLLLLFFQPTHGDEFNQEHSMELFRFHRYPTPSCTRHLLAVPPSVDLDALALDGVAGRFEWDERLGMVYTILKGVVTAIAYS